MKILTAEDILNAQDMPEMRTVEVPEWGGTLYVKTMTAGERDLFEDNHGKAKGADPRARLMAACVCDSNGNLLFSESQIKALSAKNSRAMERVLPVATELNKITESAIAEMEKNS